MARTSILDKSLVAEANNNIARVKIISLGVSQYSFLDPLPGAIRDLKLIKEIFLNRQQQGLYVSKQFQELVNPTVNQARDVITNYAHDRSATGDILIFYFSGHGCVIGGNSFGLCMTDTKQSRTGQVFSLSVLSFGEIIQTLSVAEVSPIFIIDACFSGSAVSSYISEINARMQDQIQTRFAGSYGFLCSSNMDNVSFADDTGSPFTFGLHSIVKSGLSDRQQRHSPFLFLRNISPRINTMMELEDIPKPRCYTGPDLPEVPIAKNVGFKPSIIKFSPYFKRVIEYVLNKGKPFQATIHDLDEKIGKGSYANHSKLELQPWSLLEDGDNNTVRKLTGRGLRFARGKLRIPEIITKDYLGLNWVAKPGTKRILITDVPNTKKRKHFTKRRQIRLPQQTSGDKQLRLFKR